VKVAPAGPSLDQLLATWTKGDPPVVGPGTDQQQMPETAAFDLGQNAPALFPGSVVNGSGTNMSQGVLQANPLTPGPGNVTLTGELLQRGGTVAQHVSAANFTNVSQAIQNLASQPVVPSQTGFTTLDFSAVTSSQQAEFSANASFSYLGSGGSAFFADADNSSQTHIFFHMREAYYQVSYTPDGNDMAAFFAPSVTPRVALACGCMSATAPPAYVSSVTYGSELYVMADGSATASDMESALQAAVNFGTGQASGGLTDSQKATLDQMTVHILALGGNASAESAVFQDALGDGGSNILNGLKQYIAQELTSSNQAYQAAVPIAYSVAYLDRKPIGLFPTPTAGPSPLPPGMTSSITVCLTVGNNDKEYQTPVRLTLTESNGTDLLQTGDISNATYWPDNWTNCGNNQGWVLPLSQAVPTYDLSGAVLTITAPGDSWHGQFNVWVNDTASTAPVEVLVTEPNMYYNDSGNEDPCTAYIGQQISAYSFSFSEPGELPQLSCGSQG
jgi:hypothetical protein